jgi:hypothetical protein
MEADISGEQLGDLICQLPIKTMPVSREKVLAAASDLAQELCNYYEQVAEALRDTARRIDS